MGLRFFNIPLRDSETAERELNGFLASHKVLSIDRQLVDVGMNSFWAICVDYLMSSAGESTLASNLSRSRVDYKTILRPEEFDVFSKLRQLRKELAQMVQRRCRSKSDLAQIEGIGDGKIEKYVDHLLPILMSMELICESNLQQRLAALTAFSQAAGVKSWRFRKSVLQPPAVNDP